MKQWVRITPVAIARWFVVVAVVLAWVVTAPVALAEPSPQDSFRAPQTSTPVTSRTEVVLAAGAPGLPVGPRERVVVRDGSSAYVASARTTFALVVSPDNLMPAWRAALAGDGYRQVSGSQASSCWVPAPAAPTMSVDEGERGVFADQVPRSRVCVALSPHPVAGYSLGLWVTTW